MGFYESDVSFLPTEANGNLTMECSTGKAVHVLKVTSGGGGLLDPTFSDVTDHFKDVCDGLSECSVSAPSCRDDFSGHRVYKAEYECLCEPGYALLPNPNTGACVPCGAGSYRSRLMGDCAPCPLGEWSGMQQM
jgi:hypothetical protein